MNQKFSLLFLLILIVSVSFLLSCNCKKKQKTELHNTVVTDSVNKKGFERSVDRKLMVPKDSLIKK